MKSLITTVILIPFYFSSYGSSRWLPDQDVSFTSPKKCSDASLECCMYPELSPEYKNCCRKYGCCQPCKEHLPEIAGTFQIRQNCASAWECCRYEFLSLAFQKCCNDHGCCPLCGNIWSDGCYYYKKNYSFGSVVEYRPNFCVKLVCVAEVSTLPPYLNATVAPIFYNPGTNEPLCQDITNMKCIDAFGILRVEGEEWFMSATCEQCLCLVGQVTCRPVKRPCPPAPHPNCIAISHGCCPIWDCDGKKPGCVTDGGIRVPYGETWWDSMNSCVYKKCTESGIRQFVKSCPELPPRPLGNCIKTTDETKCCEKWECRENCPDPDSYGRVCVQYFDQCMADEDCHEGDSCCLVAGCGKECMRLCIDENGICHKLADIWMDPNFPTIKMTCLSEGIRVVEDKPLYLPAPTKHYGGYPTEPDAELAVDQPSSPYDCLVKSGLNLTVFAEAIEEITLITDAIPLKSSNDIVEGFRAIAIDRNLNQTLNEDEVIAIASRAQDSNWSSILPLVNEDTQMLQMDALSAGVVALQRANTLARVISEGSPSLKEGSPSDKHQKAFRRTDPIATQMAQLGTIMETATKNFVSRVNVPISAIGALSLLGDAVDCNKRFADFLRPKLAPLCDPTSPFRTLDGTCNNLENDLWGAAFTKFRRILDQDYGNGVSSMRLAADNNDLPSARLISTKINQKLNEESSVHSILHVTYGQFLDHDLTATPIAKGYLGSTIKCCDDLRVKLDVALTRLEDLQLSIEDLKFTEPTLRTVFGGELNVTAKFLNDRILRVQELIVSGQNTIEVQLESRPPRQLNMVSNIIRPQSGECAPIPIPHDDPFYSCHNQTCMEFVRSIPAPQCTFGRREQLNQHTAYLDGSVIYGVKKDTIDGLRKFEDGLLKTQVTLDGQILLPAEDDVNDGCNTDDNYDNGIFCFKAGDGRVNEQILLAFFHTLWAREHNRVAKILKSFNNFGWDDERLFQEARRIVVAEFQHVTFNEYLPSVLGSFLMGLLKLNPLTSDQYTTDYDKKLDASTANAFATAAYRFGHSQITDFIQKVNQHGAIHTQSLSSLFFHPFSMYDKNTVEDLARGGTSYSSFKVDADFSEEISGKLFKANTPFGLDLVALNLQRGRDHGIPGYIEWKSLCGESVADFSDLASVMDDDLVNTLEEVYGALSDIDLYVGGIAERPFLDGILGPTFSCIIADQFFRIKKGDRFWYEYKDSPGAFSGEQLKQLHQVTLARIICNNIPELTKIQPEPLKNPSSSNPKVSCSSNLIPEYSLSPWNI